MYFDYDFDVQIEVLQNKFSVEISDSVCQREVSMRIFVKRKGIESGSSFIKLVPQEYFDGPAKLV